MDNDKLALTVGCTFGFETPHPVSAVLQVAPSGPELQIRASAGTPTPDHHGYLDALRQPLRARHDRRRRLARSPTRPRSCSPRRRTVIASDARRRRSRSCPTSTSRFVMPSRFCLPDELGHEAWQRFGDLDARLGARPGDRRLRPRPPRVGRRRLEPLDDRGRRLPRRPGRLPRLRPPRDHLLPRAEHPGPLRLRLHPRDRRARRPAEPMDFAAWFEVYLDGELAHVRRPQQHAARRAASSSAAAATRSTSR